MEKLVILLCYPLVFFGMKDQGTLCNALSVARDVYSLSCAPTDSELELILDRVTELRKQYQASFDALRTNVSGDELIENFRHIESIASEIAGLLKRVKSSSCVALRDSLEDFDKELKSTIADFMAHTVLFSQE
jgi:hypothetical protein